jgi:hypothetical protein
MERNRKNEKSHAVACAVFDVGSFDLRGRADFHPVGAATWVEALSVTVGLANGVTESNSMGVQAADASFFSLSFAGDSSVALGGSFRT